MVGGPRGTVLRGGRLGDRRVRVVPAGPLGVRPLPARPRLPGLPEPGGPVRHPIGARRPRRGPPLLPGARPDRLPQAGAPRCGPVPPLGPHDRRIPVRLPHRIVPPRRAVHRRLALRAPFVRGRTRRGGPVVRHDGGRAGPHVLPRGLLRVAHSRSAGPAPGRAPRRPTGAGGRRSFGGHRPATRRVARPRRGFGRRVPAAPRPPHPPPGRGVRVPAVPGGQRRVRDRGDPVGARPRAAEPLRRRVPEGRGLARPLRARRVPAAPRAAQLRRRGPRRRVQRPEREPELLVDRVPVRVRLRDPRLPRGGVRPSQGYPRELPLPLPFARGGRPPGAPGVATDRPSARPLGRPRARGGRPQCRRGPPRPRPPRDERGRLGLPVHVRHPAGIFRGRRRGRARPRARDGGRHQRPVPVRRELRHRLLVLLDRGRLPARPSVLADPSPRRGPHRPGPVQHGDAVDRRPPLQHVGLRRAGGGVVDARRGRGPLPRPLRWADRLVRRRPADERGVRTGPPRPDVDLGPRAGVDRTLPDRDRERAAEHGAVRLRTEHQPERRPVRVHDRGRGVGREPLQPAPPRPRGPPPQRGLVRDRPDPQQVPLGTGTSRSEAG